MDTALIEQALAPVVGLPLTWFGRVVNMLMLNFGEQKEYRSLMGHKGMAGDWAIHVQCPWRLCRLGKIVVAYHDFYYSPNGDELEDDEWDTSGKSQFDCVAAVLHEQINLTPLMTTSIVPDDVGGFSIHFDDSYRLDVFPDESRESGMCEEWRIFRPGKEGHFVFPSNSSTTRRGMDLVEPSE